MLGAIIGDIAGSRFEHHSNKSKNFDFLTYRCSPTDDSVMSLAVAQAILNSRNDYSRLSENTIECMQRLGRQYPHAGYGGKFKKWLRDENPQPYNSWGNGSAMRVSAAGFAAESLEQAIELSRKVTEVTHNHPEGIKGAEAAAVAIYLARSGKNMIEIQDYICRNYYKIDFTLDEIRSSYAFDVSCQGSVPQALQAFFESRGFEDAIRNAISIGGDSDTIAAITGGIAEAYYGIPADIRRHALTFLDETLLSILIEFENVYPPVMEKKVSDAVTIPVERSADRKVEISTREEMMAQAMEAADEDVAEATTEYEQTTSNELRNKLMKACDILRGPINQDEFKSYVIPILFLKRISDVFDEEYADALEFSGGDEEYAQADDMHAFKIPAGCHWSDIRDTSQNVGKAIIDAMTGIERANPDTLAGVFSAFDDATWTDKNKLTDERLKNLVEHFTSVNVGNKNYSADVMGDAYEYLIKKFADMSKKNAGEFYTPRTIVKLMVNLLDPQPGETVYDPACGTGGMLIEAIHHIKDNQLAYGKIFGQENNLSTSAIARMNLYLHGANEVNILKGDTLRNPLFLEGGKLKTFDCVLANPPFGLDKWGSAQFETDQYGRNMWGCPSDSNADYAWVQHMVKSMNPKTGRCAVVLPQGVLFHGNKDGKIREQLIRSDKIEAVITLAGGVFFGAGVSACILLLNNNKPSSHVGRICLIDGSKLFCHARAQNYVSEENAKTIYDYYKNYTDVIDYCKIVTMSDITDGGFELSVNKYIEKTVQKAKSPELVKKEYFAALDEVRKAEEKMKRILIEGGYVNE